MQAFGKGFAWANGHNLGRHWNIGPQRALYFPAPLQRKGDNSMIVFDLDDVQAPQVRGVTQQVWIAPKS
jgi:beta-galactosidase